MPKRFVYCLVKLIFAAKTDFDDKIYTFILVWGDSAAAGSETTTTGFGESDGFDSFLSMTAPPQEITVKRTESADSDECPDFSVYIKQVDLNFS